MVQYKEDLEEFFTQCLSCINTELISEKSPEKGENCKYNTFVINKPFDKPLAEYTEEENKILHNLRPKTLSEQFMGQKCPKYKRDPAKGTGDKVKFKMHD